MTRRLEHITHHEEIEPCLFSLYKESLMGALFLLYNDRDTLLLAPSEKVRGNGPKQQQQKF